MAAGVAKTEAKLGAERGAMNENSCMGSLKDYSSTNCWSGSLGNGMGESEGERRPIVGRRRLDHVWDLIQ